MKSVEDYLINIPEPIISISKKTMSDLIEDLTIIEENIDEIFKSKQSSISFMGKLKLLEKTTKEIKCIIENVITFSLQFKDVLQHREETPNKDKMNSEMRIKELEARIKSLVERNYALELSLNQLTKSPEKTLSKVICARKLIGRESK